MKRLFCLIIIVVLFCGFWGGNDGWNGGDLPIGKNSINGDSSEGINFDPDADGTNEVIMEANGNLSSSNGVSITGGDSNEINLSDLSISGTDLYYKGKKLTN